MNRCKFPPLLTANSCAVRCSYKFILRHPISVFYSLEKRDVISLGSAIGWKHAPHYYYYYYYLKNLPFSL